MRHKKGEKGTAEPSNQVLLDAIQGISRKYDKISGIVKENKEQCEKMAAKTEKTTSNLKSDLIRTRRFGGRLSQNALENDIVVKGFKHDFVSAGAVTKICEIFGLELSAINNHYRFPIRTKIDGTAEASTMYIMVISFSRQIDKKLVMEKEKEMGGLILSQILEDCHKDNETDTIRFFHRLLKINLSINKKLFHLKQSNKIADKTFKSGFFSYRLPDKDDWIVVSSLFELEKKFTTRRDAPSSYFINNKRKTSSMTEERNRKKKVHKTTRSKDSVDELLDLSAESSDNDNVFHVGKKCKNNTK